MQRKLKQIRFAYRRLMKRQGKVYVEGGLDPQTGCYPIEVDLACFMALGRSVFQYALKEIQEFDKAQLHAVKRPLYDNYVNTVPIIKFFGKLRNEDIHVSSQAHKVTITFYSPILTEEEKSDSVEHTTRVEYRILKICEPSPELQSELSDAGEHELLKLSVSGEAVYEVQECEREFELFKLCEQYMEEIEKFVQYGITNGIITQA